MAASTPEEQGIDSAQLAALLDKFSVPPSNLLVIRHGVVVLDASTYPFKSSQSHALFYVTRSFVSTLVGMDSWSLRFRYSGDKSDEVVIDANFVMGISINLGSSGSRNTPINGTAQ